MSGSRAATGGDGGKDSPCRPCRASIGVSATDGGEDGGTFDDLERENVWGAASGGDGGKHSKNCATDWTGGARVLSETESELQPARTAH